MAKPPFRRGGRLPLADGGELLWSIAEGSRGRRCRFMRSGGDEPATAVLLELDGVGRPSRLEVSSSAGLLTLHPEPDGRSAHGNVVGRNELRPIAVPWSPRHVLHVVGVPLVLSTCLSTVRPPAGAEAEADAAITFVRVGSDLAVAVSDALTDEPPPLDADGAPLGGSSWPME